MKRMFLLLILAIIFCTAGFTQPGCEGQKQDVGKLVAEHVTNLAFNELADLFDKQLNKLESELSKINLSDEVKPRYQAFITDFRELSGEVRKVRTREDFNELAGKLKGRYQDLRCELKFAAEEVRTQIGGLFDGVGELVGSLDVESPVVVNQGRQPANLDNADLCP